MDIDLDRLFDRLHRDEGQRELFRRVYQVLAFAPSSRHADEEELVSLAADALDYLVTDGRWKTASATGKTELRLEDGELKVTEDDDRAYHYQRSFRVASGPVAR